MATPPRSPTHSNIPSEALSRRTRQSTRLRRLTARLTVNVNPTPRRGSGPYKEKFHSYLGVVARKKIPIVHSNWNVVPKSLKNLIWDDILINNEGQQKDNPSVKYGIDATTWVEFAKIRQIPNWQAQEIQKYNDCPHLLSRGGYDLLEKKLTDKKRKTQEQQAEFTENSSVNVDPPSPVSSHV
ncbi:hypothetical protein HKD37_19G053805 [Glycine soja]